MYRYIVILFLALCQTLIAQKHDYVWTGGENTNNPAITGGFLIDFKNHYPNVISHPRAFNLSLSSACISDSSGRLMVYTDGCDIISGESDSIMTNGDNINPGYVHNLQCDSPNGVDYYTSGIQSSLFLPLPDTTGIYYLFHKRIKYIYNPFDVITDMLYFSIIDMNQNKTGEVILKNIPLMEDTLTTGLIAAVKHANGKDWWVVTPRKSESQVYCFLFTHEGIVDTTLQLIGSEILLEGGAQVTFSPDGSKMIVCNPTGLGIFDFDRQSGQLSNYQLIDISPYIWEWCDLTGCAVSPNNRFVYVSSTFDLLQYDLTAQDIAASRELVGVYDGGQNPLATTFGPCHLAPDCKIYIQTGQQAENLHIIHRPNEKGANCDFEQRGLVLTNANRGSLPYFPNYRLGPLDNPGEPCTTTTGINEPGIASTSFSVFPNPAYDHIRILTNEHPVDGLVAFQLRDISGQLLREKQFDPVNEPAHTIDVHDLLPGVYFSQIRSKERLLQVSKIVVLKQE